jgi:tripartite-type tricarboxylate transporter receptor subunit TctC
METAMTLPRRQFLQAVAGAGAFLVGTAAALADYPIRTITLIGVAGAGGSKDTLARIIVDHMARTLGQPIIIEKEGAAGGDETVRKRLIECQRVHL